MLLPGVFFVLCVLVCVHSDNVIWRPCKGMDSSQCKIHNVVMDHCGTGPNFCSLNRGKSYTLTMDFTPSFRASNLTLDVYADVLNEGTFDRPLKTPDGACTMLTCPMEANMRRIFDVNFVLDKTLGVAKFPVAVMLWESGQKKNACCFSFSVKVKK